MKNTAILSTAAAVAMLAALAGCNPTGSSTQNYTLPYKVTEVGPGGTYVTEITRKANSTETEKETRTLNNMPFYEKSDYKLESVGYSYIQTNYDGPSATYQKVLVSSSYYNLVSKVEIFDLASPTDTPGTLVESTETKYFDGTSDISEIIQKKNGVEVLRNFNYDYTNFSQSYSSTNPYFTYERSVNGGASEKMCYYGTKTAYDYVEQRNVVTEYEVYRGWVDTNSKGTMIESLSGYSSPSSTSTKHTVKKLNETTGVLESTEVTTDYTTVTVVY